MNLDHPQLPIAAADRQRLPATQAAVDETMSNDNDRRRRVHADDSQRSSTIETGQRHPEDCDYSSQKKIRYLY